MSEAICDSKILNLRQRLIQLADNHGYKFVDTSPKERASFELHLRTYQGYSKEEIELFETQNGIKFPAIYHSYLKYMGRVRGDLFAGSDVASFDNFVQVRRDAEDLLIECNVSWQLEKQAFVMLMHQGYTFDYFIAKGGQDSPVYRFTEGYSLAKLEFPSFEALLVAQVELKERNSRAIIKSGGHYLKIKGGQIARILPARQSKP